MAIKDLFTDPRFDGDEWPEAHIKINKSVEDWVNLRLKLTYFIYRSAESAAAGEPPIWQGDVSATKDNAPPALKQAAKAYRDALTAALKAKLFNDGVIVDDADPEGDG